MAPPHPLIYRVCRGGNQCQAVGPARGTGRIKTRSPASLQGSHTLKKSVRGEDVRGDLIAVAVERLQVRATERRQQHREVEVQCPFLTVEGLVVEPAVLDLLHVRLRDGLDAALLEERLGPELARRHESP